MGPYRSMLNAVGIRRLLRRSPRTKTRKSERLIMSGLAGTSPHMRKDLGVDAFHSGPRSQCDFERLRLPPTVF